MKVPVLEPERKQEEKVFKRPPKSVEKLELKAKQEREERSRRKAEQARRKIKHAMRAAERNLKAKAAACHSAGRKLYRARKYQEAIEEFSKVFEVGISVVHPQYRKAEKYIERSRKKMKSGSSGQAGG